MNVVQDSPEHHFLTMLEQIKDDKQNWYSLHISHSLVLKHADLMTDPATISQKLAELRENSNSLLELLKPDASNYEECLLYQFSDSDLILLVNIKNQKEKDQLLDLYEKINEKVGKSLCSYNNLSNKITAHFELAENKMLSVKRITAYHIMSDPNRLSSISIKRKRRDKNENVIMIVEDDRFTSAYTTNILNKNYDILHTKTGEEAIISYIEKAPDVVLLDIHLPGISGHETMQAIKCADPEAHIVMMSVDTAQDNIVSASKFGADGFLKKPFTKERLISAVNHSPHITNS
jgi:CheY-like chemotaxis protein